MTQYIILSFSDILHLENNKEVKILIDEKPYIICSDEHFDQVLKQMKEKEK